MLRVEVSQLRVRFGSVEAVGGVDLTVPAGAAVALVGRNGAGKSTTLKVLGGVLPASGGKALVDGIDVLAHPTAARMVTGYCPDVGGLIPRATPWEHLQLSARMRGMTGWEERARDLLERFDLSDVSDRVTASFSHGMSRRLSVALAALHRPNVLLLDEPFDGVDPLGVDATMTTITELLATGSSVLLSTHLLELAIETCSQALVLRGGHVVASAPSAELSGPQGAARYRALLA